MEGAGGGGGGGPALELEEVNEDDLHQVAAEATKASTAVGNFLSPKSARSDPQVGDGLQAAATSDSFFATNPGEPMTTSLSIPTDGHMATVMEEPSQQQVMPLEPEPEEGLDTPRLGELQHEAELRAEHQAQARLTMLGLSRALENAHARQRELRRQLGREREGASDLQGKIGLLEKHLASALDEIERRKAEDQMRRIFESGNTVAIAMMLEKSRQEYKSDIFRGPSSDAAGGDDDTSSYCGSSASALSRPGSAVDGPARTLGVEGSASDGHGRTLAVERSQSTRSPFDGSMRVRRTKSKMSDGGSPTRFKREIDKITFSWIMKLWLREARKSKEAIAKDAESRRRASWEEEQRRKMEEEMEKKMKDLTRMNESLTLELEKANQEIERYRKRVKVLERQVETLTSEAAEREKQQEQTISQLRSQLEESFNQLLERESDIERLQRELEEAQERFGKLMKESESERKQLQDAIRKVSSELHEAAMMARYMRETMLKSKRDAAASVSPSKFAELIAQLEEMKDQLQALRKDNSSLQGHNTDLFTRLEKNRRRLELERQFLPLIRNVKGPLGPKVHGHGAANAVAVARPGTAPDPVCDAKTLLRSQSAAATLAAVHGGA